MSKILLQYWHRIWYIKPFWNTQWLQQHQWRTQGCNVLRVLDPSSIDQSLACAQVAHYTMDHLSWSTASMMFSVPLLSCSALLPRSVQCWECPAKQALHPCLLHSSANSRYLAFLRSWASSIPSSQGTGSNMATCLEKSDVKTKSGGSVVLAMFSGNFSC